MTHDAYQRALGPPPSDLVEIELLLATDHHACSGPAPAYQHSPWPLWATNTPLPHILYASSYVRRAVTFNAHVHAQSAPSDASSSDSSFAPITSTVAASASASTGSSLATITTTTVAAAATRSAVAAVQLTNQHLSRRPTTSQPTTNAGACQTEH